MEFYKIVNENDGEYTTVDLCSLNGVYGLAEDILNDFNEDEIIELKKLKKQNYSKYYIAIWILKSRGYEVKQYKIKNPRDFYLNLYDSENFTV